MLHTVRNRSFIQCVWVSQAIATACTSMFTEGWRLQSVQISLAAWTVFANAIWCADVSTNHLTAKMCTLCRAKIFRRHRLLYQRLRRPHTSADPSAKKSCLRLTIRRRFCKTTIAHLRSPSMDTRATKTTVFVRKLTVVHSSVSLRAPLQALTAKTLHAVASVNLANVNASAKSVVCVNIFCRVRIPTCTKFASQQLRRQ